MVFSSDEALAQIPEEVRAGMPDLGFRRDRSGQFFYFPCPSLLWGAYKVPDNDLVSLVGAVLRRRTRLDYTMGTAIFIVIFIAAFFLGDTWVFGEGGLPTSTSKLAPYAVVSGSFVLSIVATALWARLRANRFTHHHLRPFNYERWAFLVPVQWEEASKRKTIWVPPFLACLVALCLWLGYVQIIEVLAAVRAGATGVAVYGTLALLLYVALSGGLAALALVWSFARWRPAHRFWARFSPRWAPISSWAGPSEETVAAWHAEHEAAARAYSSRPLWRKLIVPNHLGRFGGVLTFLHRGVYVVLAVVLAIAAAEFWTDRRPADGALLAFFAEITAPPRHNTDLRPVIVKWTSDPAVHLIGGEALREAEALEQVLQSLSRLTGLDWHRVTSPEAADIVVEIAYGADDTERPKSIDQGIVNYTFSDTGAITGGRVTVADREWYENIFHWGLAEVAGLRGDSSVGGSSVASGAGSFTPLDRAALLLLYSAEIDPGMDIQEANERAREIVAAWPETYTVDGLHDVLESQR